MNKKQFTVAAIIATLTVLTTQHALAKQGGTSILHLTVSVPMTSSGFDADASGSVNADDKTQGGAAKQSLDINAVNLDSNGFEFGIEPGVQRANVPLIPSSCGAIRVWNSSRISSITWCSMVRRKGFIHDTACKFTHKAKLRRPVAICLPEAGGAFQSGPNPL